MRPLLRFLLVLGLSAIAIGVAAGGAYAGSKPKNGFYVFKDLRTGGVIEFRDPRGRLVWRELSFGDKDDPGTECGDSRHTLIGARWQAPPVYAVNPDVPAEISSADAVADIVAAHYAWQDPFVTDCSGAPSSPYSAHYGGSTSLGPSLAVDLSLDGANVVQFRTLAGTICDFPGVVACVIAYSQSARFVEADMALEADLTRLGGDYRWTTGDTTWFGDGEGEFAVVDVATHEWGHFAGLGHVKKSPSLTMFPAIRDGMQTLGLGDMKGLLARY